MKMQKTKLRHRVLALALALMLCVGMLPMAAFAASAGDKCPNCPEGTLYEKGGFLGCTICNYWKLVEEPDKPTEPDKHEHSYGGDDRCSCGELNPTHVHQFDSTGKCVCGEQHTHSWNYDQYNRTERFTHKAYCSCGATEEEPCTTTEVTERGQRVIKCTFCGYWEPVEDVHHWSEWVPNENGTHTRKCTDDGCGKEESGDCRLVAVDSTTVKCQDCGWVKYNDGKPSGGNLEYEHVYGTIGTSDGQGHHTLTCMNANCGNQKTETCTFNNLKGENGRPVAHYCKVCGYKVSIKELEKDYCSDLNGGHDWSIKAEVLSEDGTSVLTTLKCSKCGLVQITDICNSPSKVIVHYVDEDGKTIANDKSQPVIKGTKYSITSPTIEGYKPDKTVVAGECTDGKGTEVTVIYRKVETYTLTIKYEFVGGMEVFDPYVAKLEAGTAYEVTSPESDFTFGYAPDQKVVAGEMPAESLEVVVKYLPIPYKWTIKYVDENGNTLYDTFETTYTIQNAKLLNIPSIPEVAWYKVKTSDVQVPDPEKLGDVECEVVYEPITYTWTINYVDEKGTELFEPVVAEFNVKTKLDSVTSPTKKGYSADTPVVERPTDKAEDRSFTVEYSLSTDFALTVVHRYLNRDGSLNHEVTEKLGEFRIGDTYTTAAKNEEGYTLSLTPANANGTFGEEDVTVTYEYIANAAPVTPGIPTIPTEPTNPTEPDEPDEPIEDPDVPLGPGPDEPTPTPTPTPDPDEPIEDPDVPMGTPKPEPTPDPGDEPIEDPDVPLAPGPVGPDAEPTPAPTTKPAPAPDNDEEISDEKVPLANTPKTGDDSGVWMTLALISAAGLVFLGISRKRKGESVR